MRAAIDVLLWPLLVAVGALTLAGCGPDGQPSVNAAQPRGATVTFESIDGPPAAQFSKLVQILNEEAQARRLAVISREQPSAYHVRGYLAAKVTKSDTVISWAWDVFDQNERRALRITGEETAKGRHRHGWNVADDDMLKRIANSSMDQLAVFLTSSEAMPNAPAAPAQPQIVLIGQRDASPEAAGIFRIFRANPAPTDEYPVETEPQPISVSSLSVPLPRRRPAAPALVSARKPVAIAASGNTSAR
jgi:hypothetical protein